MAKKKRIDVVVEKAKILDGILGTALVIYLLTLIGTNDLGWGSYGWVFAVIALSLHYLVTRTIQCKRGMKQVVADIEAQGVPCKKLRRTWGPTDIWLCRNQGLIVIAHQALFANRIKSIRDKSLRKLADATADLSESLGISPEYITTIAIEPGASRAKEELVDAIRVYVSFDLEDSNDLIRNTPKVSPTTIEEAWQRGK